jgi:ppGpp synthetase/RelA/SpoT-type nucleotidyltranferase
MIPSQLALQMDNLTPFLNELKRHVATTLSPFAEKHELPFYGRVKSAASVAEKIEMGRYRKFSQIDDLVAFTLIIPTVTQEAGVVDFCTNSFDVQEIRDKSKAQKHPDAFRFDCTRVIAKIRPPMDLSRGDFAAIHNQLFEVQIRTAFEHAWSVATHDLVYKGSLASWKRLRLAAQLKATSEALDAAIASFDQLLDGIVESPSKQIEERNRMATLIVDLLDRNIIPVELKPHSLSRVCSNVVALLKSIRPKMEFTDAVTLVSDEIGKVQYVPKSVSLYQLMLGVMCSQTRRIEVDRIYCHVTDELTVFYPSTKNLKQVFDYNS